MIDPKVAGALFDFCGYLCTLQTPLTVGASCEAPPLMDHLQAWCDKRGLNLVEADVQHWHKSPGEVNLGLATNEHMLYELLARLDVAGMAEYRTVSEPDRELRVDPTRLTWPPTDICVRALNNDAWQSVDIVHLDRDSLLAWLRHSGSSNPMAERTVLQLLGHDGI